MTKFGRHLIYVQFNNMGYYRMLNTEINKNVYEILWFLTRLIRYITKHWDIFSRAFNFTQVKSFSEVEQIVWKILYAWVSAFLICLTLFMPCLTISEFRSEWKHIPLYEKNSPSKSQLVKLISILSQIILESRFEILIWKCKPPTYLHSVE